MTVASPLAVEEKGAALWVRLERPPLNVLDIPTIDLLRQVLTAVRDRRDLKVVVLASSLPGVFSAGVDIADHTRERIGPMLDAFHGLFHVLDSLPQPTVAAVDGHCLGGGCELAAFSDFVLATPASTFGQPEIDVGCFPPVAAVLLPRIAPRAAAELILGGAPLSAAEAARFGLVTHVVDDLAAATEALVARLASKSAVVLGLARRALRQGGHDSFVEALARTQRIYEEELLPTADVEEGVRAFLEKRPPRWTDR